MHPGSCLLATVCLSLWVSLCLPHLLSIADLCVCVCVCHIPISICLHMSGLVFRTASANVHLCMCPSLSVDVCLSAKARKLEWALSTWLGVLVSWCKCALSISLRVLLCMCKPSVSVCVSVPLVCAGLCMNVFHSACVLTCMVWLALVNASVCMPGGVCWCLRVYACLYLSACPYL